MPDILADKKVLIVDDTEVNIRVLRALLFYYGCQVDATDSPFTALEMAKKAARTPNPYELMICDSHMPLMSGAEVLRALANDRNEAILNAGYLIFSSDLGTLSL